ncbi:MAG: PaaI family thioesterase [Rubrivivax sp.]|jgi:uncharacterized protein (TIGR00369 family)|nr:PaaI family thioesterase [Rubrivivax sp.]
MDFLARIPFVDLLGFESVRLDPGVSEIAITVREELTNSLGVAHGGLLMTLMDIAMAHAARSPVEPGGEVLGTVVTIEMKTSFMRPGTGRVVATGRRMHRTVTMAFCEASVLDARGHLVAHTTGTFKYLKPASDGQARRIHRDNASD